MPTALELTREGWKPYLEATPTPSGSTGVGSGGATRTCTPAVPRS
jgi:hypothetical protein